MAPMRQEMSVDIARPIAEVFDYTLQNVPEWSITVVSDEVLELVNDGGVGTTFRTLTEDRGRQMEFTGKVLRHEPPHLSAIELVGQYFDIDVEYRFESVGAGTMTRVTQNSEVRGKGFTKVMFALFGWMMKKSSCDALEKELQSLKRHAEAA